MYHDGAVTAYTDYLTDRIADNAVYYLRCVRTSRPFYLRVHFTAPHTPWNRSEHPPEVWDLDECADSKGIPYVLVHRDQMANPFTRDTPERRGKLIRGDFTAMAAAIGRILQSVRELSLEDDTIVIFTDDNGMNVDQHGIWGKGNGTYPQNFYEESIRVPLIVLALGKVPRIVGEMVSHVDLFFDLEQDSREEVNLIRRPEHQREIRRLAGALDAGFRQYADARQDHKSGASTCMDAPLSIP